MQKYLNTNLMRESDKELLQFSEDKKGAAYFSEWILLMQKGR